MEILYSFKFDKNYAFEIHYTNVPKDAPKYMRFQWFVHFDNQLYKLDFDKMENNKRFFKNDVIINFTNESLLFQNLEYKLEKCDDIDNQIIYAIMKTNKIN